jgi:glucose-6-phosphate-specific signal transduction histidine kinase
MNLFVLILAAILFVSYFVLFNRLVNHLKKFHGAVYDDFGGKRIWYSAPDQLKFFKYLFTRQYLGLSDDTLNTQALGVKLLLILWCVLLFVVPLFVPMAL